ncbi:alpha/beta hydrolase [Sodalis sp. C49]|uniref:alpha/beta hydrolase n=1 Tax=Sodalis sp. C49 TaxID=3228929 RepID=UPI0039659C85
MSTYHLVDPELQPLLSQLEHPALDAQVLPAMRAQRQAAALDNAARDDGLALSMTEHSIPGQDGAPPVRVMVIAPLAVKKGRMGILHIHGGGFLMGSPEQSLPLTRLTASRQDCVVVSVDYRLSPETRFPGPLEDCFTALAWMAQYAGELGVDPRHIGVMGDSAGAGLAAGLALLARDRGAPALAFQNLMYPMLDDRTVVETDPNPITGEFIWTRESNRFGWQSYLGAEPGGEDICMYAAAARANYLGGLPPAWIGVGTLDLFLDENLEYARRLIRAGVPVALNVYPGGFHGFNGDPNADIARRARKDRQLSLSRFNPAQPGA